MVTQPVSGRARIHTEPRANSHSMLFPPCQSSGAIKQPATKEKLRVKCVYKERVVQPHTHATALGP